MSVSFLTDLYSVLAPLPRSGTLATSSPVLSPQFGPTPGASGGAQQRRAQNAILTKKAGLTDTAGVAPTGPKPR